MAGQVVITIDNLPDDALGAAALFHAGHVESISAMATPGRVDLAVVLPPAPFDHADWRRAAARDLARALAPARINLVAGLAGRSLDATLAYLANASGVTGHYLQLHGD